jgi:hypothetical protein
VPLHRAELKLEQITKAFKKECFDGQARDSTAAEFDFDVDSTLRLQL